MKRKIRKKSESRFANMKKIVLTEDFFVPGSDVILEPGDTIYVEPAVVDEEDEIAYTDPTVWTEEDDDYDDDDNYDDVDDVDDPDDDYDDDDDTYEEGDDCGDYGYIERCESKRRTARRKESTRVLRSRKRRK